MRRLRRALPVSAIKNFHRFMVADGYARTFPRRPAAARQTSAPARRPERATGRGPSRPAVPRRRPANTVVPITGGRSTAAACASRRLCGPLTCETCTWTRGRARLWRKGRRGAWCQHHGVSRIVMRGLLHLMAPEVVGRTRRQSFSTSVAGASRQSVHAIGVERAGRVIDCRGCIRTRCNTALRHLLEAAPFLRVVELWGTPSRPPSSTRMSTRTHVPQRVIRRRTPRPRARVETPDHPGGRAPSGGAPGFSLPDLSPHQILGGASPA